MSDREPPWKLKIIDNMVFLAENLVLDELLTHLKQGRIITRLQAEDIVAYRTSFMRNDALLTLVVTRPESDYHKFLQCLTKTNQQHIRDKLEEPDPISSTEPETTATVSAPPEQTSREGDVTTLEKTPTAETSAAGDVTAPKNTTAAQTSKEGMVAALQIQLEQRTLEIKVPSSKNDVSSSSSSVNEFKRESFADSSATAGARDEEETEFVSPELSAAGSELAAEMGDGLPNTVLIVGGGNNPEKPLSTSEIYSVRRSAAKRSAFNDFELPDDCLSSGFCLFKHQEKVYVVGGPDDNSKCMRIYTLNTKQWSRGPDMAYEHMTACGARIDNKLYVCGGMFSPRCEAFDIESQRWLRMEHMHKARGEAAAAVFNGALFVIGGDVSRDAYRYRPTNLVERFDLREGAWNLVAPMNTARYSHSAAVLRGDIFACGGVDESHNVTSTCERYDARADKWQSICSMSPARTSFVLASIRDEETNCSRLLALGGWTYPDSILDSVIEYLPEQDTWRQLSRSLEVARYRHSMIPIHV